ncbi:MAG: exonuclease subunit SbcD [Bacteroidetes bacterium]|nr:exonuclease subunit SbcD [Bacteroidota bacterium]
MKILHTSDWHLGQKFLYYDREEEHQKALDWLLQAIHDYAVDCLIVAGDIFDIGNPPNYARRLYYRFLTQLQRTSCRHIIIVGGNHDSPSMLNAPSELLEFLDIHVIGCATGNIEDEILEIRGPDRRLEGVIAAVPFLRDRDIRFSAAGESGSERIEKIKEGIYKHYLDVATFLSKYETENIPVLATGHLYAKGALSSEKQDNIYVGNMENIEASQFPNIFDYVALGHLHRAQKVGGKEYIRYSGSIIPLSFSEIKDEKSVNIISFEGGKLKEIESAEIPIFRKLVAIKGSFETVMLKLRALHENDKAVSQLPAWVEIIVQTDKIIPALDQKINEFTKDKPLEVLKIRIEREGQEMLNEEDVKELDDLNEEEVFIQKCMGFGSPPDEMLELISTFKELQSWMKEEEG